MAEWLSCMGAVFEAFSLMSAGEVMNFFTNISAHRI